MEELEETLQGAGRGWCQGALVVPWYKWHFPRPHSAVSDLHLVDTGSRYHLKTPLFRDRLRFCRCLCTLLMDKHHPSFINAQLRHKEVKGPDEGDRKSNCLEFCNSEISSF